MGDTIENEIVKEPRDRETEKKRKLPKPSLMAIGVIIGISLGAFNTFSATAGLRTLFPQSQTFSIGVAYSFADSQGSILLPGSTGNVTLTIVSAIQKPTSLALSFNTTSPTSWSAPSLSCTPGQCDQLPAVNRDLSMILGSICSTGTVITTNPAGEIIPENSDLINTTGGLGSHYPSTCTVTLQPGQNVFQGHIIVSTTAKFAAFSLQWFATQP